MGMIMMIVIQKIINLTSFILTTNTQGLFLLLLRVLLPSHSLRTHTAAASGTRYATMTHNEHTQSTWIIWTVFTRPRSVTLCRTCRRYTAVDPESRQRAPNTTQMWPDARCRGSCRRLAGPRVERFKGGWNSTLSESSSTAICGLRRTTQNSRGGRSGTLRHPRSQE